MKYTKEQLIELWEMASKADEVTLPADQHCALVDQAIKLMAVADAAKDLDGYHSEPCERNVMMKENPECDCGLDNLAKALEALDK